MIERGCLFVSLISSRDKELEFQSVSAVPVTFGTCRAFSSGLCPLHNEIPYFNTGDEMWCFLASVVCIWWETWPELSVLQRFTGRSLSSAELQRQTCSKSNCGLSWGLFSNFASFSKASFSVTLDSSKRWMRQLGCSEKCRKNCMVASRWLCVLP